MLWNRTRKYGRLDQHDLLGCAAIVRNDRLSGKDLRFTPSVDFLVLMCDDLAIRTEQLCRVESDPISHRPEIHRALVRCGHPCTRTRGSERGVKPTDKPHQKSGVSRLPTISRQWILVSPSSGRNHRCARSNGSDDASQAANHEASGQSPDRHFIQSIPTVLSTSMTHVAPVCPGAPYSAAPRSGELRHCPTRAVTRAPQTFNASCGQETVRGRIGPTIEIQLKDLLEMRLAG